MKHIISLGILLTAVFCLLIFPCESSAETQTVEIQYREILDFVDIDKMFKYSSEDFDYHLKDDNTAILDYYYGKNNIVYIPEEIDGHPVSEIGFQCFSGSTEMNKIIIPGSINKICEQSFSCFVDTIEIHEGVQEIVGGAFSECTVKNINIPDSAILSPALNGEITPFVECLWLENIVIKESHPTLAVVDHVLFSKNLSLLIYYPSGLKNNHYIVPNSVIEICRRAFFDEQDLKSISFPYGLKRIDFQAFAFCNLENIDLPDSVEEIEAEAFIECRNISQIKLSNKICQIGTYAFGDACISDIYLPNSIWYLGKEVFGDDVVFHVIQNSYSHLFAIENGYQYVLEIENNTIDNPTASAA